MPLFLEIMKCSENDCTVCSPVQLPFEEFAKIKPFPDPTLKDDGHYKPFDYVHGTENLKSTGPLFDSMLKKRKVMCL